MYAYIIRNVTNYVNIQYQVGKRTLWYVIIYMCHQVNITPVLLDQSLICSYFIIVNMWLVLDIIIE